MTEPGPPPTGHPADVTTGTLGYARMPEIGVGPDGRPSGGLPELSWQRLSRRMMLVWPFTDFVAAIPALIATLLAGHGLRSMLGTLIWLGAVMLILTGVSVLRWRTTRYEITSETLQLHTGLLRRRQVAVRVERVRTVDVSAHLLHRLLGLARVRIGTGRSDRKDNRDLVLDGLDARFAAGLRAALLHRAQPAQRLDPSPATAATAISASTAARTDLADTAAPTAAGPTAADTDVELARLDLRWVRLAPFTLSGLASGAAVLGVLWRGVSESQINLASQPLARSARSQWDRHPLALDIGVVVIVAVVLLAVTSTIGYLLAYYRFRLSRHAGGTLHVSRGLLTTRATSIEARRLLGVAVSEPLLLRAVHGAQVHAIATGLRIRGQPLLPPAPRDEAAQVAIAVLDRASVVTAPLAPHPPAARTRRFTRAGLVTLALVAVLDVIGWAAGWPLWTLLLPLLLFVPAALLAADRYRALGHCLVDGFLVVRIGSVLRHRSALSTAGIVGVTLHCSWFQRRVGLQSFTATTAAGRQRYEAQDVAAAEAVRLTVACLPEGLVTPFLTDPLR